MAKRFIHVALVLFQLAGVNNIAAQTLPDLPKSARTSPRLNVVFILTDDHRNDFMGFTGKIPWLKTPNMDRMASHGAYFRNAFVTTSLCSPSRTSILTGQYSHVHTIVDNVAPEPANLLVFPQYLQRSGYQTSFFGKWHMGNDDDKPRKGFDHWESFKGQGVYWNPELNIDGKQVKYTDSTYITDLLTEHAISWLKARDPKKPFFLYLSHKAVHAPVEPAKRHAGMYSGKQYALPVTFFQTQTDEYKKYGWPDWVKQQRYSWHGVDFPYHAHQPIDELVRKYCETLGAVDESVGAVMNYLEETGLDKNTVVIYMGDNGFSWGEHGLIDKRHFYEESVKVPFLVWSPKLFNGGKTITKMVQNIDIAPTVLEWAGLKKPDYMPGKSFGQLLRGDESGWRDKIFYEYFWEYDFPMTPTIFGVRTDQYKYIRPWGIWDTHELYDLVKDPLEMHNLVLDTAYTRIQKQLAGELFNWLEQTNGMQIPLKKTIKRPSGDYRHQGQF
ncbi:sulfatase family protein [Hufsiella ginkgonis]|uniref:Sulfatase-like hydrolase/transferase n=1 Tax=Hufsiella ginkgonis TaxID=2695274 RepID=A0A7K1XYS9_9SPHI|nr:sulfatase [Hufsiella ginkgonis]MXV16113.1 sulfatase-like hydrolase/transferase [Hufsiella ginkgonis]